MSWPRQVGTVVCRDVPVRLPAGVEPTRVASLSPSAPMARSDSSRNALMCALVMCLLSATGCAGERRAASDDAGPDSAARPPAVADRISEDSARTLALSHVPGGSATAGELETEGGALIYSFDVRVAGQPGIVEVHIAASDGRFLGSSTESAADEARERSADSGRRER